MVTLIIDSCCDFFKHLTGPPVVALRWDVAVYPTLIFSLRNLSRSDLAWTNTCPDCFSHDKAFHHFLPDKLSCPNLREAVI